MANQGLLSDNPSERVEARLDLLVNYLVGRDAASTGSAIVTNRVEWLLEQLNAKIGSLSNPEEGSLLNLIQSLSLGEGGSAGFFQHELAFQDADLDEFGSIMTQVAVPIGQAISVRVMGYVGGDVREPVQPDSWQVVSITDGLVRVSLSTYRPLSGVWILSVQP